MRAYRWFMIVGMGVAVLACRNPAVSPGNGDGAVADASMLRADGSPGTVDLDGGLHADAHEPVDATPTADASAPSDAAQGLDAAAAQDAGCGPNQAVDEAGQCRTVCLDDMDCQANEVCNPVVRLCLPNPNPTCDPTLCQDGFVCPWDGGTAEAGINGCVPPPDYCTEDGDCRFMDHCEGHRCVPRVGNILVTCKEDPECPILMHCQASVCVGCVDDIQCALAHEGARCVMGTCIISVPPGVDCINKQCPPGERCNHSNGECEPSCETTADCNPGEICAFGMNRCVKDYGCNADAGCPTGLSCTSAEAGDYATDVCTGCSDSVPCNPELNCVLGTCLPRMAPGSCDNVTCGQEELCDPADGTCYPSDGTCQDAQDCRAGLTCNQLHRCAGCDADGDCRPGQRCVVGTCANL